MPYLQSMADWAQKNPKAFLFIAGTISAIATAILAVNFAMAANPFTLIALGIGLFFTLIFLLLSRQNQEIIFRIVVCI